MDMTELARVQQVVKKQWGYGGCGTGEGDVRTRANSFASWPVLMMRNVAIKDKSLSSTLMMSRQLVKYFKIIVSPCEGNLFWKWFRRYLQ